MLTITITGPAKSGKTALAEYIRRMLTGTAKAVTVEDESEIQFVNFKATDSPIDILGETEIRITVLPEWIPETEETEAFDLATLDL